jgi:hypothetical protein
MGDLFRCPRCGAPNKIGPRFCGNCGERFFYTCTQCHSYVDLSFKYCPTCNASLNWEIKPQADLLAPAAHRLEIKPPSKHRENLLKVGAILLVLGLAAVGYLSYRFSSVAPMAPVGYESYQELPAEAEPQVTAPPGSEYSGSPPYVKAPGERIYLTNNTAAHNVSLEALKQFIVADGTDRELYIPGFRMCGHFAETLHNNAEHAGIKAALVVIGFEDGSTPHALNAFETTDKGLVFIDCTGAKRSTADFAEWLFQLFYPRGQDHMAYVARGKQYGTIPLQDADSPQYSYYEGYTKGSIEEQNLSFVAPAIVKSVAIYW